MIMCIQTCGGVAEGERIRVGYGLRGKPPPWVNRLGPAGGTLARPGDDGPVRRENIAQSMQSVMVNTRDSAALSSQARVAL